MSPTPSHYHSLITLLHLPSSSKRNNQGLTLFLPWKTDLGSIHYVIKSVSKAEELPRHFVRLPFINEPVLLAQTTMLYQDKRFRFRLKEGASSGDPVGNHTGTDKESMNGVKEALHLGHKRILKSGT